jgi:kinesin family protein 6/9
MMTMVLRDSLGGNCNTKMIATVSALEEDIYESLGTCKFARSVQMIQNDMRKNEQVDAGIVILRLKKEVKELKAEMNLLKGTNQKETLTQEDIERCNTMVSNFVRSEDPASTLVLPDRLMINHCFYYFRTLYNNALKKQPLAIATSDTSPKKAASKEDDPQIKEKEAEIQRLNMLVKQRDNEIGILLNYLNKQKEAGDEFSTGVPVESAFTKQSTEVSQTESSGKQEETKQGTLF